MRFIGYIAAELPSVGGTVASGSLLDGGMTGLMSPGFGRIGLVMPGTIGELEADEVDGVIKGEDSGAIDGDVVDGDITVGGPKGTTDAAPGIEGVQTPLGHGASEEVGAVAGTV